MEKDLNTFRTIATILFFLLMFSYSNNSDLKQENSRLKDDLYEYEYALGQANSNIEEAQWYAWESYEDMGYALENLETVEP